MFHIVKCTVKYHVCHTHFSCAVKIYHDRCFSLVKRLVMVVTSLAIRQPPRKLSLWSHERFCVLATVVKIWMLRTIVVKRCETNEWLTDMLGFAWRLLLVILSICCKLSNKNFIYAHFYLFCIIQVTVNLLPAFVWHLILGIT